MRPLTAALLLLSLVLGACASDDDPPAPPAEGDADGVGAPSEEEDAGDDAVGTDDPPTDGDDDAVGTDDPTADDGGDVTLTLLTHDSFDLSEEVLASFTAETGTEVRVVPSGDAGTALNQAILTADAPQGDLLFGVDSTFLSRALDEDLFVPYRSPRLDDVAEDLQLDPDHRATPVTVGDVCLNHDVAWFDEHDVPVPTDLADLADPVYEDLLVVQNPATSSPGLAFLLATIARFGDDHLDVWASWVDNGVLVTDGWSEAYYDRFSATGDGDRPLVVSYASSPPAEVYFADPQPDQAPTGVIEASCYRQVEFVGILRGTAHEAEAQALVDHLLSVEVQQDVPLSMFVFPVLDDAELPPVFDEHAVVPDDPLELDPTTVGEQRDTWIADWTEVVLR